MNNETVEAIKTPVRYDGRSRIRDGNDHLLLKIDNPIPMQGQDEYWAYCKPLAEYIAGAINNYPAALNASEGLPADNDELLVENADPTARLATVEAEAKGLREALEHYADKGNWGDAMFEEDSDWWPKTGYLPDGHGYDKAQAALAAKGRDSVCECGHLKSKHVWALAQFAECQGGGRRKKCMCKGFTLAQSDGGGQAVEFCECGQKQTILCGTKLCKDGYYLAESPAYRAGRKDAKRPWIVIDADGRNLPAVSGRYEITCETQNPLQLWVEIRNIKDGFWNEDGLDPDCNITAYREVAEPYIETLTETDNK